jgi:hypothetical protein
MEALRAHSPPQHLSLGKVPDLASQKVKDTSGTEPLRGCPIKAPPISSRSYYESLVAAQNRSLQKLNQEIADAIKGAQ